MRTVKLRASRFRVWEMVMTQNPFSSQYLHALQVRLGVTPLLAGRGQGRPGSRERTCTRW